MTIAPAIHTTFGEDTARTRRTDDTTSHEAADTNDVHASIGAVLDLLREEGAMTDEKIEARLADLSYKFTGQRLRTARAALVKKGLVRQNGYGQTTRGRRSQKWEAVKQTKRPEPLPDYRQCGACDIEAVVEVDRWAPGNGTTLVEEWKCTDCGHWNSREFDRDDEGH